VPRPAAPPPTGRVTDADEGIETPSLAELLVDMAEEGRRVRGASAGPSAGLPTARRIPVLGCVFRLILLLVFLGLLAAMALSMLFNGAF
jgi:hypothetical protein